MFISHDAIADSMNKLVGCWCIAHGCVNSSDNWLVLHGMAMQFHCFSRPMELIYMYIYCWCPYWRGYMTVTHINVCTSPYCCFNTVNVMHHESWNVQFSKWKHSINLILGINSYILYIHINQTRPYVNCIRVLHTNSVVLFIFFLLLFLAALYSCFADFSQSTFFPSQKFFFSFCPFWFQKISQANCDPWELFDTRTQNLYLFINIFVGFPLFNQFLFTRWLYKMKIDYHYHFFQIVFL